MAGAETLHASAVAVGGAGLLIRGRTGAGKSTLALGLIARGAELVSDDRVILRAGDSPGDRPVLEPPPAIAGLLEAHGIGIIRLSYRPSVPLMLVADLDTPPPARLPERRTERLQGRDVPVLMCRGREGLADTLYVLLGHGELIDPDRTGVSGVKD